MNNAAALVVEIRDQYPLLELIERRIAAAVGSQSETVERLAFYVARSGGKRIRPTLTVLSAACFQPDSDALIDVAAAGELIHMASLVHDDVIDRSPTRRGRPTVNALKGNHAAVLTGDFLFATAFQLLTKHQHYGVLGVMTAAIRKMCEGEIDQGKGLFNLGRTENEYYDQIKKKTASLLAACCQVGAAVGGASPLEIAALRNFGLNLGCAFQITDDLLDLVGDQSVVGKPSGQDLREGIITLPLIYLLHSKHGRKARRIIEKRIFTSEDLRQLRKLAVDAGAVAATYEKAREFVDQAKKHLVALPHSGPARRLLISLADAVVDRKN